MWISVSQGIQFIPSLMVNVNKVQVMQKVSELCKVAVQSSAYCSHHVLARVTTVLAHHCAG